MNLLGEKRGYTMNNNSANGTCQPAHLTCINKKNCPLPPPIKWTERGQALFTLDTLAGKRRL